MKPFWRRRRELLARRRPRAFVEDPENEARRHDAARQMRMFDQLTPEARARLAQGAHDVDVVDAERAVRLRGPSEAARRALKARGVLPCDVPLEELVSIEIVGG